VSLLGCGLEGFQEKMKQRIKSQSKCVLDGNSEQNELGKIDN